MSDQNRYAQDFASSEQRTVSPGVKKKKKKKRLLRAGIREDFCTQVSAPEGRLFFCDVSVIRDWREKQSSASEREDLLCSQADCRVVTRVEAKSQPACRVKRKNPNKK